MKPAPPSPEPRLLYDLDTAAEALSISRSTLYREITAGRLRIVSVRGRRLVPRQALEAYAAELVRGVEAEEIRNRSVARGGRFRSVK